MYGLHVVVAFPGNKNERRKVHLKSKERFSHNLKYNNNKNEQFLSSTVGKHQKPFTFLYAPSTHWTQCNFQCISK